MTHSPVQLLILGFDQADFHGQILAELDRLRAQEVVRLIDALVIHKRADGSLSVVEIEDDPLTGLPGGGRHVRALVGIDEAPATDQGPTSADAEVWYPGDLIPVGATVALALIEHVWAEGLQDAITSAGGSLLAESWVHSDDLASVGLG